MFIISRQASIPAKPSKRAFNHPASWKVEDPWRLADDDDLKLNHIVSCSGDYVFICAISPDQFETAPTIVDMTVTCLNSLASTSLPPVLSGMPALGTKRSTVSLKCRRDMPFASGNLLVDIHTAGFTAFRRFEDFRLSIMPALRWPSALLDTHFFDEYNI